MTVDIEALLQRLAHWLETDEDVKLLEYSPPAFPGHSESGCVLAELTDGRKILIQVPLG